MRAAPLALMSGTERASYCTWLLKLVARRKGSIAQFYRRAAAELSEKFI